MIWHTVISQPFALGESPFWQASGGVLYTIGAVVYAFKWPDPAPKWFGYHEVFHAFTVAAFIVHYIGVSILAYST